MDLSGDATALFLLCSEHLASPGARLAPSEVLLGHVFQHDLAKRAAAGNLEAGYRQPVVPLLAALQLEMHRLWRATLDEVVAFHTEQIFSARPYCDSPERDGCRVRLGDDPHGIDEQDRRGVRVEELVIVHLRGVPIGLGGFGACPLEVRALDLEADEERNGHDDRELDEVLVRMAPGIGQQEVGQPQERRPHGGRRRAGQSVTQRRVADRHEEQV